MTIVDYLFYALLGICVVFFVLVLIMAIVKLLTAIVPAEPKPAAAKAGAEPDALSDALTDALAVGGDALEGEGAQPLAPGSAGEVKLYGTDPRTAAMIMAIVADELGKPLNELRFISIREVSE